ncbi:winged helix-turn-helix transcriptional regulator [Candidatus Lokiarchaeum ossiferum]|uniref:winged helix-turn-helix transcriptional regulator n=1 Tax=Candidatus Lokiarchaeum ossiferum TaxID=2951803 RepID=UPI00352D4C97
MVTDKIRCEAIFSELSRKWSITIIKDLFLGCKTFSDFLVVNENLSNKVLSEQLKRLEELGFIKKVIVSTTPLKANYILSEMGKDLNRLVYEKIMFGLRNKLFDRDYPLIAGKNLEHVFGIK